MDKTFNTREGSTEYIKMTLKKDGVAVNLTGHHHLTLVCKPISGTKLEFPTNATSGTKFFVTGTTLGQVEFRPATNDLAHAQSPYACWIEDWTGSTVWDSYPADSEFDMVVRPRG